jgi:RHS repeat-associated protein
MLALPSTSGGGAGGEGWLCQWDDENRLAEIRNPQSRIQNVYDGLGRRRLRRLFAWDPQAETWTLTSEICFVWDGWNLLAELSPQVSSLSPQRVYTLGIDLSGQLGGEGMAPMSTAGGIGGILACSSSSSFSSSSSTALFLYDGNGNVTTLASADSATTLAAYEYGPFGNTLVAAGPLAETNPIRFSTEYFEGAQPPGSELQVSGFIPQPSLYYYGYRYYSPELGRWVSRDPIGEEGGVNLHAFVLNAPPIAIDVNGLSARFEVPEWLRRLSKAGQCLTEYNRLRSIMSRGERATLEEQAAEGALNDCVVNALTDPRYRGGTCRADAKATACQAELVTYEAAHRHTTQMLERFGRQLAMTVRACGGAVRPRFRFWSALGRASTPPLTGDGVSPGDSWPIGEVGPSMS